MTLSLQLYRIGETTHAYRFKKREGHYIVLLTVRVWPHAEDVIGIVEKYLSDPTIWRSTLDPKYCGEDLKVGALAKTRRRASEKLIDLYTKRVTIEREGDGSN